MKKIFRFFPAIIAAMFLALVAGCNVNEEQLEEANLSIRSFLPETAEVGQTVSIIGDMMTEVTAVRFEGGVSAASIRKVGHNQIDVVVPEGALSGRITVACGDKEAESEYELKISNPEVTSAFPSEIQTMEVMTINGTDLNTVSEVIFPDDVSVPAILFERKCNEQITVKVPEGTIDGTGMVRLKTASGKLIDVMESTITVVEITENSIVELVAWEGSAKTDWSNTKIAFSNSIFDRVPAGAEFIIYFEPVPTNWAVLKIKKSVAQNKTFENAVNPDGNWGYAVDENSTECSFVITQNDLDMIAANPGDNICVQGQGEVVVTKVVIRYSTTPELVAWEGSAKADWSDTKIAFSNSIFRGVPAGAEFVIYFDPVPTNWAVLKIKKSVAQNKTFENAVNPDGNWGYAVDENSTECSFVITQNDLDMIAANPDDYICVQGQGEVVITKVVIRYVISPELLLWEGAAKVDWSDTNINIPNTPFLKAKPGSKVKICFEPVPTNWAVLKIKKSVAQNKTFANAVNPDGNWGYAVDENSTECSFEITEADLAMIAEDTDGSICVQGQGDVVVTAVYLVY